MRSIMQSDRELCYLCGKPEYWNSNGMYEKLEEHHVFSGPNRKLSEKYGLKVYLHGITCHREGADSAHKNKIVRKALQAAGQKSYESVHGSREDFVKIFGKNYV